MRTYRRKGASLRGQANADDTENLSDTESTDVPLSRPLKRRKLRVDVVSPSIAHNDGVTGDDHVSRASSNGTLLSRQKTNVQLGSLSEIPSVPRRLASSDTLLVSSETRFSPSPQKFAKDLSDLFSFGTEKPAAVRPSTKHKPSNIAKRMLRRTGTESLSISSESSQSSLAEGSRRVPAPPKLSKALSEPMLDTTLTSSGSGSRPMTPLKVGSLDDVSSPPMTASARASLSCTNIRTYAGQSRSFLVALPTTQIDSLSRTNSQSQSLLEDEEIVSSQADDFEIQESYTDLRMRWGVDNSEDDPRPVSPMHDSPEDRGKRKGKGKQVDVRPSPLPPGMMNDLKSITELRSKGESRRFLDEVGYLFEGLDAKAALGVRRSSALEIVTKLCDLEFSRKAKAADFLGRAWEVFREAGAGNGDKVLNSVLVFFAALVSRDSRDLADLAAKTDFASTLYDLLAPLEHANDPLWLISCSLSDAQLKKAGIPRLEKTLLSNLHKLVREKSGLVDSGDIISNRLLISMALTALPSHMQSSAHLPPVLKGLTLEIRSVSSRISAYITGLSLIPLLSSTTYLDTPSLLHVDNCLQLLDTFLLGRWANQPDAGKMCMDRLSAQREKGLAKALINLCVACDAISRDPDYLDQMSIASRCMESTLRVLINLTHDDLSWCQAVLQEPSAVPTIMRLIVLSHWQRIDALGDRKHRGGSYNANIEGEQIDRAAPALDRLCLALGLLTNLVQVSHEARETTNTTLLDFRCKGKRACTRACRCTSRVSAVECLALVYADRGESESELDPVVRGHMAVLFGLIMQNCPENQKALLGALPGRSAQQKLDSLIEHAREFTLVYAEFTKRISSGLEGQIRDEQQDDFVHTDIDGGGESVLRDRHGESVAKDVVSFLELLRTQV
ncbi:uncharacterized protein FIBRA_08097 [Fibroporia radiculosa]|uniref:Wings apart-like protein C-terminal domain-containing protein n=1 Tax=Fibroporia radiculosa TaxID=599839 RepID=J4IC63_9APHY|nr:uncharacterized protein FIBRA_08097 [Fibroporia radiculosa]CCM05861.1 predicted protein [Fibroporia radiculosa]